VFFDEESLGLGPFLLFGGEPGQSLPDIEGFRAARHTKGNSEGHKAERPALRVVPKSRFDRYESVGQLYVALFGEG
jgi:hypothetical protein